MQFIIDHSGPHTFILDVKAGIARRMFVEDGNVSLFYSDRKEIYIVSGHQLDDRRFEVELTEDGVVYTYVAVRSGVFLARYKMKVGNILVSAVQRWGRFDLYIDDKKVGSTKSLLTPIIINLNETVSGSFEDLVVKALLTMMIIYYYDRFCTSFG